MKLSFFIPLKLVVYVRASTLDMKVVAKQQPYKCYNDYKLLFTNIYFKKKKQYVELRCENMRVYCH